MNAGQLPTNPFPPTHFPYLLPNFIIPSNIPYSHNSTFYTPYITHTATPHITHINYTLMTAYSPLLI